MPNTSHPGEVCHHLSYEAWQTRYLTDSVYNNLAALISINSISAITAILLNALVIIVVATKQQLRTPYNILLACLAATDLLVGVLVQPLFVASEIKHIRGIGPFCALDTVLVVITYSVCGASIGHLVLISVERYVFIKLPLRYEDIVTEERITGGVLMTWAVSASVSIMMIVLASINSESEEYQTFLTIFDVQITFIVLVYVAVIVYSYVAIFLEARKHKRRLKTEQLPEEEAKRLRKNNKAANTLTIILMALLFSYILTVIFMGYAALSDDLVEPHVIYVLSAWSYTFIHLGSLFNPLIYCWRMKKLRRAFLDVLHLSQPQVSPDIEFLPQHNNNQPAPPNEAWIAAATS